MPLLRPAAALVAAAALCAAAAPAAVAAAPGPNDKGLYGKGDPTYDGVFRQSLALLAQDTAGVEPAEQAVAWLTAQQCDDGSFPAYRAKTDGDCDPEKALPDSNATAVAVQALSALETEDEAVDKATKWLRSAQNDDGGWSFNPGGPSDANSTSVVVGAFAAAGVDPATVTSPEGGKTPYDGLAAFRLDCDAKDAERGAYAYQPDKKGRLFANDDATAAAVLAAYGKGMVVQPGEDAGAPEAGDCEAAAKDPAQAAEAGAAYLDGVLEENERHLESSLPGSEGQPDFGNTADAVLALAAGGHTGQAKSTADWLADNTAEWEGLEGSPAALGQLVLAAHATGTDPAAFGGMDLVKTLNATGPAPQAAGTADKPAEETGKKEQASEESGSGTAVWVAVGAALVAALGGGAATVARRKRHTS